MGGALLVTSSWVLILHSDYFPLKNLILERKSYHNLEIDIDRLAVLKGRLESPLADRLDRRLVETKPGSGALNDFQFSHRPVCVNHRAENDLSLDMRPAGHIRVTVNPIALLRAE